MSRRHLDVVYVGSDQRRYTLVQRFVGESTQLWASVQWLRDPADVLDAEQPDTPTVWLLSAAQPEQSLLAAVGHLAGLGLAHATAVLAGPEDPLRPPQLRPLLPDAVRLLDPTRLSTPTFERLLTELARTRR